MTKKELVERLKDLPDDTLICYEDPNFGGVGDEFSKSSVKIKGDTVLIECPYWEPVD